MVIQSSQRLASPEGLNTNLNPQTDRVLAIHCSTKQTSVAYYCPVALASKHDDQECTTPINHSFDYRANLTARMNTEQHHSQALIPLLDQCLKEQLNIPSSETNSKPNHPLVPAELIPAEHVDVICIDIGPGSFMSLRIATAAAKALSLIKQRPIFCVDSLALLAAAYALSDRPKNQQPFISFIDARRQQWYYSWWQFNHQLTSLQALSNIQLESPTKLTEKIPKNDSFTALTFTQAEPILITQTYQTEQNYDSQLGIEVGQIIDLPTTNLAEILIQLYHQPIVPYQWHNARSVEPIYIRNQVAQPARTSSLLKPQ